MSGDAVISGNRSDGQAGGGVYLSGSSATMTMSGNAVVSGNKAQTGGGVAVNDATFRMAGGTVYGNTEAVESNRNTCLGSGGSGASLLLSTTAKAQYGT